MKQVEVVLGVDTHLDVHVGAVISETGKLLGTLSVSTRMDGYLDLLTWAQSFGYLSRAGVEGTGTYGAGLTRVLLDHKIEVYEVNRPDRSDRRFRGKSDTTDAESAARAVISGKAAAIPKDKSGAAEAMRTVSVTRRSAVKAKTQAINQLRSLLVSAPQDIRERLSSPKTAVCIANCAGLQSLGDTPVLRALTTTLRLLAKRWKALEEELQARPASRPPHWPLCRERDEPVPTLHPRRYAPSFQRRIGSLEMVSPVRETR